jgi:aminopeptidase N
MKRLLFLIATLFLSYQTHAQQDGCKDELLLHRMEREAAGKKLAFRSSPFTGNYDVKYHRMEWTIDPQVKHIAGRVTTYFEPATDGFQQIYFELSDTLTVNVVLYHGSPVAFQQTPDDYLIIDLPAVVPMGKSDSISITYLGEPLSEGFGSFKQGFHEQMPIIWTLSEPYGAKNWWPCKQDLNDKIDSIDVIVRTPKEFRAASNGVLVDETISGTDAIYHWKHRYPIPAYLIAIAVTNYTVYSDYVPVPGGDPIEVLNYVYPENYDGVKAVTPITVDVMMLFNELFGLYPFADEKYGHAQFGFGGGMEHQTMSFMGGFSHLLQAHELAHQWFGDKITCGSWQHIWLNEGFATYSEGLTYNYGLGNITWKDWLRGKINHVTSQPGGSVFVDDTTNLSRIFNSRLSYSKGAMLLHMLRWKMGDDDFFQSLRNYLNDPALAYGYARTDDLKQHLESQSTLYLTEFFEDWFYGQGYPSYHINWSQSGDEMTLVVHQNTSDPSVDFFEMPIPIRFYYGGGQNITLVFEHEFSGQEFKIPLPFSVDSLAFDPDLWLVSANNTIDQAVGTLGVGSRNWQVVLFPNPSRTGIEVRLEGQAPVMEKVELMDSQCRRLLSLSPDNQSFYVEMGDLPAGVYQVRIFTKEGLVVRKVVKM